MQKLTGTSEVLLKEIVCALDTVHVFSILLSSVYLKYASLIVPLCTNYICRHFSLVLTFPGSGNNEGQYKEFCA